MDLKKLSVGERILAGGGLLMVVDLLFLPWHHIDFGVLGSVNRTAVESPNGALGLLALLLTAILVTRVALAEFTTVKLPDLPVTWAQADLIGTLVLAGLLALKLVLETTALSIGAWLGIGLAAALVYGAYVQTRERGIAPRASEPEPA